MPWNINNLKDLLRKCRLPRTKMRLVEAIFCNLVYTIWAVRNEAVWKKSYDREKGR